MIEKIIVLSCLFVSAIFYPRSFISGLIDYRLNKGARKKRKKGQTFIEWLLYLRYQDVLPTFLRLAYYIGMAMYPLLFLIEIISILFQNEVVAYIILWLALLPTIATFCMNILVKKPFLRVCDYGILFDRAGQKQKSVSKSKAKHLIVAILQWIFWLGIFAWGFVAMMP